MYQLLNLKSIGSGTNCLATPIYFNLPTTINTTQNSWVHAETNEIHGRSLETTDILVPMQGLQNNPFKS